MARAAARGKLLTTAGLGHRATLADRRVVEQMVELGYEPTQKRVSWAGCALFTFDREVITDVWVLGDLKSLEAQLHPDSV